MCDVGNFGPRLGEEREEDEKMSGSDCYVTPPLPSRALPTRDPMGFDPSAQLSEATTSKIPQSTTS